MMLSMLNREAIRRISPELEAELEHIMATISNTFTREHDAQGHHTNIRVNEIRTRTIVENNPAGVTPSVANVVTETEIELPPTIIPDPESLPDIPEAIIYRAYVDLSVADVQSGMTTPGGIQLVAAPGADKVIVPIHWSVHKKLTAAFNSDPIFFLTFGTSHAQVEDGSGIARQYIDPVLSDAGDKENLFWKAAMASYTLGSTTVGTGENESLRVTTTAGTTGGTGTVRVTVLYYILDILS